MPTSNEILMLLNQPCIVKERSRFDNTFEWYAGELMIRKFAAFSASHGVTIKDLKRNSNEKNQVILIHWLYLEILILPILNVKQVALILIQLGGVMFVCKC